MTLRVHFQSVSIVAAKPNSGDNTLGEALASAGIVFPVVDAESFGEGLIPESYLFRARCCGHLMLLLVNAAFLVDL